MVEAYRSYESAQKAIQTIDEMTHKMVNEAGAMIQDALAVWIQGSLDAGLLIPEPQPEQTYSGKFSLRLPKSLHRDLALIAKQEGISLNQYVNSVLSRDAGKIGTAV